MFNIITPTYNRAHLLHRVYESLKHQTFKDFKWIVVDDGSTDGTKDLVSEWIITSEFIIEYHLLLKNQGKPAAVNYGLDRCDKPYTIIADSDDSFIPETLEELFALWSIIERCSEKIGAIWTLVRNEQHNIIGDYFPKDMWQVSFKDRILNNHSTTEGEKWHCWKTEIIKNQKLYSNPECHIGESHTWNDINKGFDFLCVNIAHRIYYFSEDGLINKKISKLRQNQSHYYSSYYGLRNVSASEMLSYRYYQSLAFEYIKSKFYYSDNELKLSTLKYIISLLLFLMQTPMRVIKRL